MILPVYIRNLYKPFNETLIYAMLDTQSDTTFISERTLKNLKVEGKPTQILISTMTSENKTVKCRKCDHLLIRGFNCSTEIRLPTVYSRKSIPANRDHIPRVEMLDGWPHLEPLRHQLMPPAPNEIGLLVGYDCNQALAPREALVAGSKPEGPFALRTDLGWGIVGIVSPMPNAAREEDIISHRILAVTGGGAQITLPARVKELNSPGDCLKLLESDFADRAKTGESPSLDEKLFLQHMNDGIRVDDTGHYSLPLPFNNNRAALFDNRDLVVGRMKSLKNKFKKNPTFKDEYVRFMNDTLERGFAEEVSSPTTTDGDTVWYIPHFGTYHKVKQKLRIVFDCAAKYRGVCLNDTLRKGPDLVNALIGVLCRFRKGRVAFQKIL